MSKSQNPHLSLSPAELQFGATTKGGFFARMTLKNTTDKPVGFKFKTNAPTRYSVKPVVGVVAKDGDVEIMVKSDSKVHPQDRFLIQTLQLEGEEPKTLNQTTWKDLDRTRITETFIECKLAPGAESASPSTDGKKSTSTTASSATAVQKKKSSGIGFLGATLLLLSLAMLAVGILVPYEQILEFLQYYIDQLDLKFNLKEFLDL